MDVSQFSAEKFSWKWEILCGWWQKITLIAIQSMQTYLVYPWPCPYLSSLAFYLVFMGQPVQIFTKTDWILWACPNYPCSFYQEFIFFPIAHLLHRANLALGSMAVFKNTKTTKTVCYWDLSYNISQNLVKSLADTALISHS